MDLAQTERLRAASQQWKNANTGSARLGIQSILVLTVKFL